MALSLAEHHRLSSLCEEGRLLTEKLLSALTKSLVASAAMGEEAILHSPFIPGEFKVLFGVLS